MAERRAQGPDMRQATTTFMYYSASRSDSLLALTACPLPHRALPQNGQTRGITTIAMMKQRMFSGTPILTKSRNLYPPIP